MASRYLSVSIHAPVMDAIFGEGSGDSDYTVSIHAPVMDAIGFKYGYGVVASVSIHAPVMDAILRRQTFRLPN